MCNNYLLEIKMNPTISAEMVKVTEMAKKQLFRCINEEQVESVFSSYGIDDVAAKIELLRCCMQIRNVYSAPNDQSIEDTYKEDLSFFVEGAWRQLI
jgi:hypothetical protein